MRAHVRAAACFMHRGPCGHSARRLSLVDHPGPLVTQRANTARVAPMLLTQARRSARHAQSAREARAAEAYSMFGRCMGALALSCACRVQALCRVDVDVAVERCTRMGRNACCRPAALTAWAQIRPLASRRWAWAVDGGAVIAMLRAAGGRPCALGWAAACRWALAGFPMAISLRRPLPGATTLAEPRSRCRARRTAPRAPSHRAPAPAPCLPGRPVARPGAQRVRPARSRALLGFSTTGTHACTAIHSSNWRVMNWSRDPYIAPPSLH